MFKEVLGEHYLHLYTRCCACGGFMLESSTRGYEPYLEHLNDVLVASMNGKGNEMNLNYKGHTGFEQNDGTIIEVGANLEERSNNNVYLSLHYDNGAMAPSGALEGVDQIKAFLWQVAYDGGLVDEDGEITVSKPKEPKVVPEDGVYLGKYLNDKFYVTVLDGRVLVPQDDEAGKPLNGGKAVDQTNSYLTNEKFDLSPVAVIGKR